MPTRSLLHFIIAVFFLALSQVATASEQPADKTERLGVPGPVAFEGQNYALARTAHPSADYFQQEYLPPGQQLDGYTHMFMIEALTTKATPKDAAASQVAMLDQRKAKDPLVNHEVTVDEQTGDVMLDFLVSGTLNGQLVVEWNAYRFASLKGDKPGIVLQGVSRRAYGEADAKNFVTALKDWRKNTISALSQLATPPVTPKP